MAEEASGYSVGNLKIAFSALDKTSDDFKKLATNLRAIVNLINRISTADLDKFTANVKAITKAFTPFLTKISKSTEGLQAFDSIAKQIGFKNAGRVLTELEEITKTTKTATDAFETFNHAIKDGDTDKVFAALSQYAQKFNAELETQPTKFEIYQQILDTKAAIEQNIAALEQLKTEYLGAFNTGDNSGATQLLTDISNTEKAISDLKSQLADLSTAFGTPFNAAQAQVSRLTQDMLNLYFATGDLDNEAIQQIRDLTDEIDKSQTAVKRALMSHEELTIAKYRDIQATRKQRIAYLEAELGMGASGKQARQYAKELEKLRKEDGEVGKKSGFAKFLGQIKRIAVYRLIRSGLKAVTSAFKDGINALAQFDSSINKTMSQLTTSFTVMKLSVSTALLPLLQSITPIIQQISVGFANMANVISASMSKTGYYTKINTDRLLAYNKAANLFDFDKFRALNKGDDAMNLLSTEKVEDLNKDLGVSYANYKLIYDILKNIGKIVTNIFGIIGDILQAASPIIMVVLGIADAILYVVKGITLALDKSGLLAPVLGAILGYLVAIGVTNIMKWFSNHSLVKWLKAVTAGSASWGNSLIKVLGTTQALAVAIGALIGSISYYVQSLDKMNMAAKITIPIVAALAAVFTGLAVAKAAAAAGIAAPAMAGITAAALVAAIVLAAGTAIGVAVGKYANGGLPDRGSMFVAGENGAEFVYNMPSGQSGVANIQQIAQAQYQAMLQALHDYGAARGDMPQLKEMSATGIYEINSAQQRKRGLKPVNV